ncbi:MAG: AAA family ATPase [Acidimicrobiia bacterium]|nr:AAA family ATPase [Acidimicrobiia bacterium]
MELLDRAGELRELETALANARGGQGGAIFVTGEAGIGKTRLITAFLDRAGKVRPLFGLCDDLLAPRAFGPFREIARTSGELPSAVATEPERDHLLAALVDAMDSKMHPAILVIEDAQWADEASLDVIRYLSRRMTQLAALLIVSFRDDALEAHHPLIEMAAGTANRAVVRLRLGGLSEASVAELAAGTGYDPADLLAMSGGNPFYLGEVLAAAPNELPQTIRDTVAARAARLSDAGRSALEVLAVVPNGASPTLARALFNGDTAVIEEAEASGLLDTTHGRLRFRHELGRRAIDSSLSFARRMACNRIVLDALEATGADPATLVHFAVGAGEGERAAAFARAAIPEADRVASHREVWTLCRIALEHTATRPPLESAELHLIACRAGNAINSHMQAKQHADHALSLIRSAEGAAPQQLAEALLSAALTSHVLGRNDDARRELREAVDILRPLPVSETLGRCYAALGGNAMVIGSNVEAIAWANLAIEMGEKHGWFDPQVRGLGVRGVAKISLADESGFEDLDRACDLGATHGPVDRLLVSIYNTAVCHIRLGKPRDAEPYLEESERIAREHGFDNKLYHTRVQQALMLTLRGQFDEAEHILDELIAPTDRDPGAIVSTAYAVLGRILSRRGDPRATDMVERGWRIACDSGEHQKIAIAGISKLEHAWLEGDTATLRELSHELTSLAEDIGHLWLRAEVMRHLARLGDDVKPFDGCPPGYALGMRGDWSAAARAWDQAGQPYEQALELVESPEKAVAFEGLRILDRLGAARTADVVRQRLRGLGLQGVPRGPRQDTVAAGGLTSRQIDVVGLIAEGLTNAEIADRLFVSRRTVDNHVSAILTRLGVESRHDAVEHATSQGLLTSRS